MGFEAKCKLCGKQLKEKNEFTEHLKLHPFTKPCEKCLGVMQVAENGKGVRIHAKWNSVDLGHGATMYECAKCGYLEFYRYYG